MEYEKVIDKVKKLQALVDRGERGEVLAAKRALDDLCAQYNIDIDTLFDEKEERVSFKLPYNDKLARRLLFQCYCKITNRKEISYQHNKYSNIIYFSLTKTQEIDLRSMFDFYWKQLKKERAKILDTLAISFVNKHNIFSDDKETATKSEMTFEKWEELKKAMLMMSQLEEVSYHKQLE